MCWLKRENHYFSPKEGSDEDLMRFVVQQYCECAFRLWSLGVEEVEVVPSETTAAGPLTWLGESGPPSLRKERDNISDIR